MKTLQTNYLTDEETLPSYQIRITEQCKFTYYPLVKASEKQIKTIEDPRRKQVEVLKVLKPEKGQQDLKSVKEVFPKKMRTNEITGRKKVKINK